MTRHVVTLDCTSLFTPYIPEGAAVQYCCSGVRDNERPWQKIGHVSGCVFENVTTAAEHLEVSGGLSQYWPPGEGPTRLT